MYYRLTAKGRSHLNAETVKWKRLATAIGLIVNFGETGAPIR
jgi:hypothetical protein